MKGSIVAAFRMSAGILILLALVATNVRGQTLTTLAAFNGSNGALPAATLTLNGNTLYGTTDFGGANEGGTVFSLPVGGGTPTVLSSLPDDGYSHAGVTLGGNTLYGGTNGGGYQNIGTLFSVPVSGGTPTVLAEFDGWVSTPTLSGSTLYGMGGSRVFSVPVGGGTPTTLSTIPGANSTLMLVGNTLYGVGGLGDGAYSDGDVFSVPTGGGTPTVLGSFNGSNGYIPVGGLTLSPDGSTFYGVTNGGGAYQWGTVISLPVSGGTPTVLPLSVAASAEIPRPV